MNFSNSEESDFEDVYQVKDIRDVEPKEEAVDEEQAEEQAAPAEASVMLSLSEIDAQWLSKHLKEAFGETRSADEMAKAELVILDLLGNEGINQRDCEKKLLQIIGHKKFTFVRQLMKHRPSIYYGTLLS
jgi:intergrase/recombinase